MDLLRVIRYNIFTPEENMALDESIAMSVGDGTSPTTLRFYGWKPSAVSIGYFQEVRQEVDLEYCHQHNIDVVRRITGGGAVIHADGELTYSFSISDKDPTITKDIQGSYLKICSPLVSALNSLGAKATFKPVNDIEIQGRKVSGNAQTRRFGAVLQHGTLLIDFNPTLLGAIKVNPQKLKAKGVEKVELRLITLREALGRTVKTAQVEDAIVKQFAAQFGFQIKLGEASWEELSRVPKLTMKYKSIDYLFRR
ncbi:MAG: lipoate--protein ligase family protein [Candidatus Methanomethylicus sp.]|nr:lipoate--protein ligase family protein [Candidatus Methanomethylicus sp.]